MASSLLINMKWLVLLLVLATATQTKAVEWTPYENGVFGYQIDLPIGMFEVLEQDSERISLYEVAGHGQIDVYGADNSERLTPQEFAAVLETADRIEEVTYRAGGRSWIVLSGHYRREGGEDEDLIFYAKFMFSPDRSRLAAFEISYPRSQKIRFDPIVSRLEKSLRAPEGR